MKISTTLFMAFLLSALTLYYFVWERPVRRKPGELGPARILELAEGDSVVRLGIRHQNSKDRLLLTHRDSGWMLVSPVSYPAEDFLVEGMVRALSFTQRLRRFPLEEGGEGSEYGFSEPAIEVSIEARKAGKRTLVMGSEAPTGTGVFARWREENEYFLVPREVKASFERSLYSLRRKKIFRLNWDDVTWLQAQIGKRSLRLQKSGDGWRRISGGPSIEIPVEKVSELIYAFQSLYVKEFRDGEPVTKKEFGFEERRSFLAAGGAQHREKLFLGRPAEGLDAVYAFREKENLVVLVSHENLKSLLEAFEVTLEEAGSGARGHGDRGKNQASPRKD